MKDFIIMASRKKPRLVVPNYKLESKQIVKGVQVGALKVIDEHRFQDQVHALVITFLVRKDLKSVKILRAIRILK